MKSIILLQHYRGGEVLRIARTEGEREYYFTVTEEKEEKVIFKNEFAELREAFNTFNQYLREKKGERKNA